MKQRRVASLLVGVAMLPLLGLICSHASGLPTEDEGYPAYGTSTPSVATVDGKARPIAPAALRVADDEGNDPTAEEGSGPPPESDEDRRLAGSGMDHLEEIRRAVSAAAHPVAPARITMAGEGVFRAKPDAAVFRLGVRSYSEKAATAMEANAKVARRHQEALAAAGVKPDEIATEQISLETEPGQDPGSDRSARYVAQNSISVDIRDLPSPAPTFLGGIVVAARRDAVDYAMVKAATYVHVLGAKVGRIAEVRDSGVGSDPAVVQAMGLEAAPPVLTKSSLAPSTSCGWGETAAVAVD